MHSELQLSGNENSIFLSLHIDSLRGHYNRLIPQLVESEPDGKKRNVTLNY